MIQKRSPHFGGLWEAAVKSAKRILKNILLHTPVTIEELSTFIIEVESILNSRPLSPFLTDLSNLQVLTPGHFLIGEPLVAIPELNVINPSIKPIVCFEFVHEKQQNFWSRWKN
jgi:hypothetical protein